MQGKLILPLSILVSFNAISQELSISNLTCENKKNPLGVERVSPGLSWQLRSNQRSVLQTAYRILVADNPKLLEKNIGNVWDSKKVISDRCIQVKYEGAKLSPAKIYSWKVMAWDNKH